MFKLTLVALALCVAVVFAQAGESVDSAAVPIDFEHTLGETENLARAALFREGGPEEEMDVEEHKLKAYKGYKYAAMPAYGVPSYGIPTYGMPSYGFSSMPSYGYPSYPSYGLASMPSYGYPSYPSYGYGYPLPMKMALFGQKNKYHF